MTKLITLFATFSLLVCWLCTAELPPDNNYSMLCNTNIEIVVSNVCPRILKFCGVVLQTNSTYCLEKNVDRGTKPKVMVAMLAVKHIVVTTTNGVPYTEQ